MGQPLTAAVRYLSGEREPVRVATTSNITLQGLLVIDDVELDVGDRILVKDQTDQKQNGIYLSSEGRWFRAPDASHTRAINEGVTVAVQEGTANNGRTYRFSSINPVVGVDPITLIYFLSDSIADDIVSDAIAAITPIKDQAEDARDVAIAAAGSVVTRDYDTVSALSALTVPSAASAVLVFGNDAAGDDNGGDPVTLFRDTSEAKPAYLLDQDGNHFAYLSRVIKLSKMFHGAKTDGTGDNSAAIVAAIDEVLEKGGGEIILPAGRYQTNGMSSAKTIGSTPIEFTFQEGSVLAGASGFSVGLIRLVGGSAVEREGKVTFNAPKLDCSLGAYTGNQPSGINLSNFIDAYVNEIDAYGGELYSNYLTTGVGGDAAVETINVFNFQARGGKSKGFLDSDFYCGGANDQTDVDDGGSHLIDGITFCHSPGIRWKRAGRYLKVVNCTFFDCYLPVSSADVGSGQEVDTGQQMDVIANKMVRSGPRAIEYRAQTKGLCMGNVIQDVGFSEIGAGSVTSLGANQSFIFLSGSGGTSARKVLVANNMMEMRDQSVNTQVGIRISDYTDQDSVLWSAGGIQGVGNHFTNIPTPLFDNGSGGASQFMKNFMGGGATPTFLHFQQGTVFEYQGGTPSAPATFQQRRTAVGVGAPTRYIDTAAFSVG